MNSENVIPNELETAVGELAAELIKTAMQMSDSKRVWSEAFGIALKVLNGISQVEIDNTEHEILADLENIPRPKHIH